MIRVCPCGEHVIRKHGAELCSWCSLSTPCIDCGIPSWGLRCMKCVGVTRRKSPRLCLDCGAAIARGGRPGKCRSCGKMGAPIRLVVATIISENPCLTLQEVGDLVGVSRERVRQLVVKDGLTRVKGARLRGKPVKPIRYCEGCGKELTRDSVRDRHMRCRLKVPCICRGCGKGFEMWQAHILSQAALGKEAGIYCSNRCKWDSLRKHPDLTLNCHICGIEFTADTFQWHKFHHSQ